MKNSLQTHPLIFKVVLLVACFMLVIVYNKSQAAGLPTATRYIPEVAVSFKNDSKKNQLRINVKTKNAIETHLFIFSPDGILIDEVLVSTNKTITVKGLKKGFYLYECFNRDARLKSGTILIK